jgi:hypothetical protein
MLPFSNGIISGFGFLITAHKRHASNSNAPVRTVKYAPYRITDINRKFARSQHGKAALKKRNFTLMNADSKNCERNHKTVFMS